MDDNLQFKIEVAVLNCIVDELYPETVLTPEQLEEQQQSINMHATRAYNVQLEMESVHENVYSNMFEAFVKCQHKN